MENINITPIIETVIALVSIVVTTFLVPYIKTKMTANQFSYLEEAIKVAVSAAGYYLTEMGAGKKKEYVENHVKKICEQHKMTFDTTAVRQMIEKSWLELAQAQI